MGLRDFQPYADARLLRRVRPSDITEADHDRERMAIERRAQLLVVVGHGDISPERAHDIAIAESMRSSWGLGASEGFLLDEMTAAMAAGMTCADIEIDHEPVPLLPEWVGRLGAWLGGLARGLWDHLRAPSPF
jgi:hypothetical protein